MTHLDDVIRRALEAEVTGVEPTPEAEERLRADLANPPNRGRRPWIVVITAAAAAIAVVVAMTARDDSDEVEIDRSGRDDGLPTTSPGTAPNTPVPGPLPSDFIARSSSWISTHEGWVVGEYACGTGVCGTVGHTSDQGATWQRLGDLPASTAGQVPELTQIRFGSDIDGWVSGPDRGLLVTHDGGATWTGVTVAGLAQPDVRGLEAASGVAWALIAPDQQSPARLYRAPVGSDSWEQASDPIDAGIGSLALQGETVFVAARTDRPVVLVAFSVGGALETRELPDECTEPPALAPWDEDGLFVVCSGDGAAGSSGKYVFSSTDGGRTWDRRDDAPLGGMTIAAAAADEDTVAITARSGGTFLYVSHDGGRTWTEALFFGDGGTGLFDLGFTTPDVGVVVYGGGQLYRTTDGGRAWSPVPT